MSNTVRVTDKFDAPCLCGRLIPFSDSDKSKTHNIDQVIIRTNASLQPLSVFYTSMQLLVMNTSWLGVPLMGHAHKIDS